MESGYQAILLLDQVIWAIKHILKLLSTLFLDHGIFHNFITFILFQYLQVKWPLLDVPAGATLKDARSPSPAHLVSDFGLVVY